MKRAPVDGEAADEVPLPRPGRLRASVQVSSQEAGKFILHGGANSKGSEPAFVKTMSTKSDQHRRSQVPKTMADSGEASEVLLNRAKCLTSFSFQQPINCCGVTSVAYVLTALGYPTSVDDVLLGGGVDVETVVDAGMTLAELHDVCLRYVSYKELPVFVECYHFDAHAVSHEAFLEACSVDAAAGTSSELILNFHSAIAHGKPKAEGGGHFSVMVGMLPKGSSVLVADVHPLRYGAFWSCPSAQMFQAMSDKDSCGRARGMLRLGLLEVDARGQMAGLAPSLVDWTAPPAPFDRNVLQRYIPRRLNEGVGAKNLAGASALALAARVLEGKASPLTQHDEVMRALQESYTFHLNNFLSPARLLELATSLCDRGLLSASASLHQIDSASLHPNATAGGGSGGELLREALAAVRCGEEGVVVLVAYDANEARATSLIAKGKGEASVLSHGASSWSLLAAFDSAAPPSSDSSLVVAASHGLPLVGRLWATSLDRMAAAMRKFDCDGAGSLLVLRRAPGASEERADSPADYITTRRLATTSGCTTTFMLPTHKEDESPVEPAGKQIRAAWAPGC